jgi:GMP synthase-like glutamine amidotransferase
VGTALVITHTESEDPGLIAVWLKEEGLDPHVVEPWQGDALPALDGYQAVVVMGGPQQAYDDSSGAWLRETKDLMRRAVTAGLPLLGVCLGAQLLAEATGGRVAPCANGPELGARLVGKRDLAGNDPLFWDLPLSPIVVQWHFDEIVDLPPGATLLMSSPSYPHQAFRVGDKAWGIQFHIETDADMVARWVQHDLDDVADPDATLAGMVEVLPEIEEVWGEVVRRFARLALGT